MNAPSRVDPHPADLSQLDHDNRPAFFGDKFNATSVIDLPPIKKLIESGYKTRVTSNNEIYKQTPIARAIFSNANVAAIQRSLINEVAKKGYVIDTQSPTEIFDILNDIVAEGYNGACCESPERMRAEVLRIDTTLIAYAVPNIINNLESHLLYLNTIDRNPVNELSLPELPSKGDPDEPEGLLGDINYV